MAEAEEQELIIEQIEIFPVRYPTVMRFKFFEGPTSGSGRPAVIIKITGDDGSVGWSVDGSPTDAVSVAFLGYFGISFDLLWRFGDDLTGRIKMTDRHHPRYALVPIQRLAYLARHWHQAALDHGH